MRDTLKESLMKQWELESARKEQMGALAHDLKTPLTVIRGNVQLMGEAESLEEAQKYSLALEQEIQGIEEYLQILQEMISTGGYQMYKKEQVDIRELTGQFQRADRSGGCLEKANDSVLNVKICQSGSVSMRNC